MTRITIFDLNLQQIADSGQCFRMCPDGDGKYSIIASDRQVTAVQENDGSGIILDCDPDEYEAFWRGYFDIDTDYSAIRSMADPRDDFLYKAVQKGSGIRILKQDLWEMIVTFLISQQNNIPRIKKCIENICVKYGRKCTDRYGKTYHAFPVPGSLSSLGDDDLMECNLGYRSKYVVRAARAVENGDLDLDMIRKLSPQKAREELLKVYGIGSKVADCVCLFALHDLNAFPVDTHIKTVLEREYGEAGMRARFFERYEGYLGVMQQYIFYAELKG